MVPDRFDSQTIARSIGERIQTEIDSFWRSPAGTTATPISGHRTGARRMRLSARPPSGHLLVSGAPSSGWGNWANNREDEKPLDECACLRIRAATHFMKPSLCCGAALLAFACVSADTSASSSAPNVLTRECPALRPHPIRLPDDATAINPSNVPQCADGVSEALVSASHTDIQFPPAASLAGHALVQVSGTLCNLRCHLASSLRRTITLGLMKFSGERLPRRVSQARRKGTTSPAAAVHQRTSFASSGDARHRSATVSPTRRVSRKSCASLHSDGSIYSLELRWHRRIPETNDPIRGEGTFDLAMNGVRMQVAHGFLPIITVRSWPLEDTKPFSRVQKRLSRSAAPAWKSCCLPSDQAGSAARSHGYGKHEFISAEMIDTTSLLLCNSRVVSASDVTLPILVDRRTRLGGAQDACKGYSHACPSARLATPSAHSARTPPG